MVHNGIEYGDMQLICEAYQLLKDALGLTADELHEVFAEWNKGELDSYLIEITARSSPRRTTTARRWSTRFSTPPARRARASGPCISALDLGMPVTLIGEVGFRALPLGDQRRARGRVEDPAGPGANASDSATAPTFIEDVRRALYCSKIISYAQGYMLLREAAKESELESELRRHRADVARRLHHPQPLPGQDQGSLRQEPAAQQPAAGQFLHRRAERVSGVAGGKAVVQAIELRRADARRSPRRWRSYDGYRTARLPANLLQAQRDFFGAHTYERVDQPRGQFFHTNWTGRGGRVSSTTYNV